MPITKSAKKALRGSARKRSFNSRRKEGMKQAIKTVVKAPAKEALNKLSLAYKAIDKAAKRGVIKKNTAARKKSKLAALIKKQSVK